MTDPVTDPPIDRLNCSLPMPPNEADRLAALRRYQVLDTPPEAAFDRITALAARLFNVPIALVSLLDESRAWFKSAYGFEPREVQRDATICSIAVLYDEPLVVLDTRLDDRFSCNPFVMAEPGLRSYIGAPLITPDGFNLGTLCLLDTQPREAFSAEQVASLADLAALVVDELELRLAVYQIAQTDAALVEITQGISSETGDAFFLALVQHFAKALQVDYTYIGLVSEGEPETIRTIAACGQGQILDNFEYALQGTPCEVVLSQRQLCCYPSGVQTLFPNAPMLAPLEIDSYVAIPFFNAMGRAIGLLGVMHRQRLESVQLAQVLLSSFAMRIAAELDRQQAAEQQTQLLLLEQTARQQAENTNRLKDEFLAVLSHELRTPLNPIVGWAKLLKAGKLAPERIQPALETIDRNAQLLTQLIEDLLDMSRIVQGKLLLNPKLVDLRVVVEAAIETVQLAADAKQIKLQAQLTSAQVMGDAGRLQQAVWNLLTNAIKFTPSQGQVEINLTIRGRFAQVSVKDTGKGIKPEFLTHVFDSFRQADSATTREFGGLGLGLAIVRQVVELHGGKVRASSRGVNRGATFTLQLPLAASGMDSSHDR